MNLKFNKIGLILLISILSCKVFSQTTIISGATNNGNFEAGAITPWVIANNNNNNGTNRWVVNTGIALAGTKSAHITNDAALTYA
ncbi:MAG: hypothetical protein IPH32_11600 [Bacteroidetes bacterium]|nr:hypothetical protein [Bacteroidota bacterium]